MGAVQSSADAHLPFSRKGEKEEEDQMWITRP